MTAAATTRPLGRAAECLGAVGSELEIPLGDRVLIDGSSGQAVEVREFG